MDHEIPKGGKGSRRAESSAKKAGYRDYDSARAFALSRMNATGRNYGNGPTSGSMGGATPKIKGASAGRAPASIANALSWTPKSLLEYVGAKWKGATGK